MVEVSPDIASKRQSVPPRAAQWKDNNSPHNSQDISSHKDDNLHDHNNSQGNNPPKGKG